MNITDSELIMKIAAIIICSLIVWLTKKIISQFLTALANALNKTSGLVAAMFSTIVGVIYISPFFFSIAEGVNTPLPL